MSATTNRRFTELYRNSITYQDKQTAISELYNHALINSLKDGEPVLARYMAYFEWDDTIKQYVICDASQDVMQSAVFTRILSNENSLTTTKEYINGDYINVSGENVDPNAYTCISQQTVNIESQLNNTSLFSVISGGTPKYIKTVRVLMAVATVFNEISGDINDNPPKGRLTIFEEDDAIRELVNQANISSPDGTINITDITNGKTIEVNIGSSLIKNTTEGDTDFGKIDVNIDDITIKQHPSNHLTLPNKLFVHHGNTIIESTESGSEGRLDVNIDNITIKQNTTSNKLYVNVNPSYGLESDSSDGIKVKLGEALAFRTGDSTASNNGKIDVKYDDNTIGLNNNNQLIVNFHSGTMERKSHSSGGSTVYDGWGVKHGTTIEEDTNGIHVNIDRKSIQQYPSDYSDRNLANKLYIPYQNTLTLTNNGFGVNIDNKTIKQHSSGDDINKLYVNIDGTTLISDISGMISVNPVNIPITGENAITVQNDPLTGTVTSKKIKLAIDSADKVLTQSANGLLANLEISDVSASETLPTNVLKRYRLLGKNTGTSNDPVYTQIGDPIDIYKDSSLYSVYLGHLDDSITSPTDPTVIPGYGDDALCFIYQKSDGTYELVKINVESFLQESEFKDGLQVNSSHQVSVKLWNGLVFGTGDEGKKPVEVRLGSGLSFDEGTEQLPITDGIRPIKVNIGNGLVMDNNNIKVNLGTGLGFDTTTGNEGKIYINYATIGAANRPIYWDGTNHTPVQIDYEINKTVPADAVFTDTTYSSGNEITIDSTNNHINHDVKLTGDFTPTTSSATISGWGASGSVKIPVLTINQYGHTTNASEATLSITFPEAKIIDNTLVWPDYTTTHLSPAWQTIITENAIVLNTPYDTAFNKLDKKLKGLADELINAESVWSQAIEDEPRYFAKSSSGATVTAMTATLVESRNFAIENNKPINGSKIDVYFSTAHTTESATLNINDTGAFPLVYNDSNFDTTLIQSGTTLALVFDKEYNNNTGCYRVVGGVGSGSGSTNGITHVNGGNGTVVTKGYTEVTIDSTKTTYGTQWFTGITQTIGTASNTIYRVTTGGNYYNMAYKWDGTKYVLSTEIQETVSARLGNGLVFGTGTDGGKPIEINLADNMIPEGSTSGSATEINNLGTLLKFTTQGKLAMENTWDCGTY